MTAQLLGIHSSSVSWSPQGQRPVNLLFFVTVVLLILVSVQLSYELSRHEARIRRLAEEVALLTQQLKDQQSKDQQRDGD
jgi:uncharacterized membrane protein